MNVLFSIFLVKMEAIVFFLEAIVSPPWACHLVGVVELVCLSDPKSYASGDSVPGGFNRTGLVEGQRPDKGQPLALQVGGWALG